MNEYTERLKRIAGKVVISSTMHEPQSSTLEAIRHIEPLLSGSGLQWCISATDKTRGDMLNPSDIYMFASANFNLLAESAQPLREGENGIERNHIQSLKLGLESSSAPVIFYMDSDRFSMGLAYYPDETIEMLERISGQTIDGTTTIVGRSPSATNTHHTSLVLTESIINHHYSLHLPFDEGLTDVAATAHAFSRDVLEKLLRRYQDGSALELSCSFPQAKLQLMARLLGATQSYFSVNNPLRYEAPEQMRGSGKIEVPDHSWTPECYERVTLASRLEQANMESMPSEWRLRLSTVYEFLNVLKFYGSKLGFGFEGTRIDETLNEVNDVLNRAKSAEDYKGEVLNLNRKLI